jgi:hypothetical protein
MHQRHLDDDAGNPSWDLSGLGKRWARDSREGPTTDIGPQTIRLSQAPDFVRLPGRGGSVGFAMMEQYAWLTGNDSSVQQVFAPNLKRFTGGTFVGSYGPRVAVQMPHIIDILTRVPDSRQAVIHTHDHWDNNRSALAAVNESKGAHDIPCITEIHLWVRKLRVYAHAIMRSTDLWMGLYYDIPYVAFLAARLAEALMSTTGEIWLTTTSLHLYERNWVKLKHYVSGYIEGKNPSEWDPAPMHQRQNYTRSESIRPAWLPPPEEGWHWPTPDEALKRWHEMTVMAKTRMEVLHKEATNGHTPRQ